MTPSIALRPSRAARVAPDPRPAARSRQGAPAPALPGAAGPSRPAGLVAGPHAVRGRRGRDPHAAHRLERRGPRRRRAARPRPARRRAGWPATPMSTLEALVRPAGTYRLKARRLLDFTRWLLARFGGDFRGHAPRAARTRCGASCSPCPASGPRRPTRSCSTRPAGPVFVADAYTRRVLARHRLLPAAAPATRRRARSSKRTCRRIPRSSTSSTRCWWPSPRSHCRTVPRCESCPLRFDLGGRPPAPCAAEGSAARSRADLQQQVDEAVGGVGDGQRARALAHLLEAGRIGRAGRGCARASSSPA